MSDVLDHRRHVPLARSCATRCRSASPTRSSTSSTTAPATSTSRAMEVDRIRGAAPERDGAPARGDRDRRALRAGPRPARGPPRVGRPRLRARRGLAGPPCPPTFPAALPRPPAPRGDRAHGRPGAVRRAPPGQGGCRSSTASGARSVAAEAGLAAGLALLRAGRERRRRAVARRRAAHRRARQGRDAASSSPSTGARPRSSSSRPGRRGPCGHEMGHGPIRYGEPDRLRPLAARRRVLLLRRHDAHVRRRARLPTRCASGTR